MHFFFYIGTYVFSCILLMSFLVYTWLIIYVACVLYYLFVYSIH